MIIKNIANEIQETLKARERALARKKTKANKQTEPDWWKSLDISDMAARTTFVRMISNKKDPVIIAAGEVGEGSGNTPFGFNQNIQKGDALYWDYDNEGIKPKPGIKDISVEYKGGYKAIREATINWSVNSLMDLERLTPHFLTVGKTLLLEWGWVTKKNRNKLSSFFDLQTHEISDQAFQNPVRLVMDNKGDYDAMAGVISNFEYTLNESGGFDCVTKMVSTGANLFESQKADSDGVDIQITPKEDGTKTEPKLNTDGLINAILNIERIVFHNYFELPWSKANSYQKRNLSYTNWVDYGKDKKQILSHWIKPFFGSPGPSLSGFSSKKRAGWSADVDTVVNEDNETIRSQSLTMSPEEAEKKGAIQSGIPDSPESAARKAAKLEERRQASHNARSEITTITQPNSDAFFTASTFVPVKSTYISSEDVYVRWGWFEDNILSRYTGYSKGSGQEILNTFRSVETTMTENGKPTGVTAPVLIRNNKDYLLPKNPMRFFLPGQNIKYETIDFGMLSQMNQTTSDNPAPIGQFLKLLLSCNSQKPFAQGDGRYGSLRNIMVNTKEIKKAFGIEPDKATGSSKGQIYYSEVVKPPSTVKAGVKRLLSQLNDNFFNFWKFEIVTDTFSGNMKIIDVNSSPHLDKNERGKLYSTFVENSSTVQGAGLYKFPSFKMGSIVKNQNLSFKIPDSMAVTAMYGSNKNKGGGVIVDTSNENSILETIFANDLGDNYQDNRLKGLEKAWKLSPENSSTHNIGSFSPDSPVRFDGSFEIDADKAKKWWGAWSTSPDPGNEPDVGARVESISTSNRMSTATFGTEAHLILQGTTADTGQALKVKENNKAIKDEIKGIEEDDKNYQAEVDTTGDYDPRSYNREKLKQLKPEAFERVQSLRKKITILGSELTGRYYTFKHVKDSETSTGYELSLFTAGEAVLKSLLFGYDKKSSVYQANFVIPAELSLTVDGIGGLVPGDIIQTDYIQPKYNTTIRDKNGKEKGPFTFFQIFNITQKVDSSGWFTDLTTKMRVNNDVLALSAGEIMTNIRDYVIEGEEKKEDYQAIPGAVFDKESQTMVSTDPTSFMSGSISSKEFGAGLWAHGDQVALNPFKVKSTYDRLKFDRLKLDPNSAAIQEKIYRADQNRSIDKQIVEVGSKGALSQKELDEILNSDFSFTLDVGKFQDDTKGSVSQTPLVKKVTEEVGAPILTDEDIEASMKYLKVDESKVDVGTFQDETKESVSQTTTEVNTDLDEVKEAQLKVVEEQGEDKNIQTISTTKERRKDLLGKFGIVFEGKKRGRGGSQQTQLYEYGVKNSETGETISTKIDFDYNQDRIPKKLFRPAYYHTYMKVSGQLAVGIHPKTIERYNLDMKANWPTRDSRGNYIIIYDIPNEVFNYNTSKKNEFDKPGYLYQKLVVQAGISEDKASDLLYKRSRVELTILNKIKRDALSIVKGLVQDGTLT